MSVKKPRTICGRGFTLVELLVVVSIIALLVSILLPSMRRARDQAKLVKCQSNLRSINQALLSYVAEYDSYPIVLTYGSNHCIWSWCTWSYGGWLGRNEWWSLVSLGAYRIPAIERPLTVYMNKGQVNHPIRIGAGPKDFMEETGQPVFHCPSDTVSPFQQERLAQDGHAYEEAFSSYDDIGTSYQLNMFWLAQTCLFDDVDHDGDGVVEPALGQCHIVRDEGCDIPNKWSSWPARLAQGEEVVARLDRREPARFISLDEDPFDFGYRNEIQSLGWHREFSRHNTAFFDGHVSYMTTDTRKKWGPDWSVMDEDFEYSWPMPL